MAVEIDPIYRRLGDQFYCRRMSLGLTQQELADRVGISRAAVASMETGRQRILLETIIKVGAALRIAPSKLLRGIIR